MQCNIKKLPKGMTEITITVEPEEAAHDLNHAATHISEERPIPGYRPGKAGYDVVKEHFGEQAIYEAALPSVVRRNFVKAVKDNELNTYGDPEINVTKLAPGNPIEFVATVAIVPEITALADAADIKIDSKKPIVEDKEVAGTIKELQRMQTKEVRANREVGNKDKVVVDMIMSKDGVPLDGGQALGHGIYLDEDYYIPGLKEKIIGMKEGDSKEFTLPFPKDHYQKNLAGQDIGFKVTVKEVYELQHPEADDDFAKKLGQDSLDKLKDLLRGNILKDKERKEQESMEQEIMEKMVEKSRFGEIPERMVQQEVDRMIHELKHSVNERGLEFEDYLKNIKKTIDDLKLEFAAQSVKRIKSALLLREYGIREKIEVLDDELLAEVNNLMNSYSDNAEAQETLRSEEYQDYIRTSLRNRKVLAALKEKVKVTEK